MTSSFKVQNLITLQLILFCICYPCSACSTPNPATKPLATKLSAALSNISIIFTWVEKNSDLYELNIADGTITAVLATPANEEYPALSPDGKTLAFYSDQEGANHIFTVNLQTKESSQLTRGDAPDEDPAWTPDGRTIIFQSARAGGLNLFKIPATGGIPVQLTSLSSKNTVPQISPDGKKILYSSNGSWPGWDLMILDLENGKSEQLTSGLSTFCRGSWDPSGKVIAYSRGSGNSIDIWLKYLDGSSEDRMLISRPGRDYDARWINSAGKLAMVFASEIEPGKDDFKLFYQELNSDLSAAGEPVQLITGPGKARYPSIRVRN